MRTRIEPAAPHAVRALLVILAVTLFAGCGIFSPDESDPVEGGGDEQQYPLATSPAIFVSNFEAAWEDRNLELYDDLLHEEFVFWLSPQDIDDLGIPGSWDRAREIATAEQMFGTAGDPDLQVQSIEITTLDVVETWTANFDNPNVVGADLRGTYSVEMSVVFPDRRTNVLGLQNFYLKEVTREIDGVETGVYQLFAWEDLGVGSVGKRVAAK